ncbi:MAG: A24 family peptidase [Kitasatospora sp.]|jgi:leader peptidase (prepilin peptidase)/N-methyltransferase|nr:A24 family peptidase [Kitasatospora sp.]
MRPVLAIALAAAGLAVGPVLRALVVATSVPSGQPWRRSCPACEAPLRWAAVPALPPTGRCPARRDRIGPPVLAVELVAAAVLALLAARIHPVLVLAAACWLAVCVIPLAFVDAATRRLPDLLTGPAWAGTAALLLAAAASSGDWSGLGRALLGGVVYAAFCALLFLISPSGIGPGDIKLAASLGTALAWLGWATLAGGVLAGFLLGAGYGIILLASGRADRKTQIPFGPFMIAGTFLLLAITGLG